MAEGLGHVALLGLGHSQLDYHVCRRKGGSRLYDGPGIPVL